jgi:hypothetical protein
MPDELWTLETPREEMLARVAARGSRIRVMRGVVNALAVLAAFGMTGAGVGAAVRWGLGDGSGTEVDGVALGPEPPGTSPAAGDPDGGRSGRPFGPGDPAAPGAGLGSPAGGPSSTGTTPESSSTSSTAGAAPGSSTSSGVPSTSPSTSSSVDPVTTTTLAVDTAPSLGNIRFKTGELTTGSDICRGDAASSVSVEIEGAESATVTWRQGDETEVVEMVGTDTVWSAEVGSIAAADGDGPVTVTVEATGEGGTALATTTVDVVNCTPEMSVPGDPEPTVPTTAATETS